MPRPTQAELGTPQPDSELPSSVARRAREIGLGELSQPEVRSRFGSLRQQLENGLKGTDIPRLLAIRTGIPIITADVWQNASRKPILVGELGGENQKLSVAQRELDGSISLSAPVYHETFGRNQRQTSFDKFIARIAEPVVAHSNLVDSGQAVDIGISLGLPHRSYQKSYGTEAVFDTLDGILPKETAITDWQTLAPREREIVRAVRSKVEELSKGKVKVGIGVVMNDTPGVAEDSGAVLKARNEGFVVLRAGAVGGTGTNGAIDVEGDGVNKGGLVNTEIGHAAWPDDPVSRVLRQRLVEQGLLPKERGNVAELEHETGSYIPRRIAAGVALLGEEIIPNAANLAARIEEEAATNLSLVSDLATSKISPTLDSDINTTVKGLAQASLDRAKQVYGILFAVLAERVQGMKELSDKPAAFLTEGSVILKATKGGEDTLKAGTERVAAQLVEPFTIYEASGMKGVAGVTMSWKELRKTL
jgi:hypothetical protein